MDAVTLTAAPAPPIWQELKAREIQLLETLQFLSEAYRRRAVTRSNYCWPSRRWLAARLGCSIRTITRYTAHLAALGLLRVIERRPSAGTWRTNLYKLTGQLAHLVASVARRMARRLLREPPMAHKPPQGGLRVAGRSPPALGLRA